MPTYGNFTTPVTCDLCNQPIEPNSPFVDGRTQAGSWAIMCRSCYTLNGTGLGEGYGQWYILQKDGKTQIKIN